MPFLRDLRSVSIRIGDDRLVIRECADGRDVAIVLATGLKANGDCDGRYLSKVSRAGLATFDIGRAFPNCSIPAMTLTHAFAKIVPQALDWWQKPGPRAVPIRGGDRA